MRLIGLSGTNGAGKDTVAEILAKNHGFLFISMTDMLRDEAIARGLTTDRENLRTISAEWRREHGLGVLVDRAVELYKSKGGDNTYSGLVISSIRNPGEIDSLHTHDGKLLWVDADVEVRYERIQSRKRSDDPATLEEFVKQQEAEMQHSGDEATLSMADVKARADQLFMNDFESVEDLEQAVETSIVK